MRLILNDGTVIEGARAGLVEQYLYLYLPNYTMREASNIMIDNPSGTERITFEYGEMADVYEGYTNCITLAFRDGQIIVCMVKE